jgi:hypothetical protein
MTPDNVHEPSDEQLAELAQLADGTLPAGRRAEVEARVAASPELTELLRAQTFTLDALHRSAEQTGAPARLRARVEQRGARRRTRRRLAPFRAVVTAGVAAAIALALALPGVLSGGLTVADAAAFAEKPSSAPAPAAVPGTPQLLNAKVGDVPFPNYAKKFGWKAVGARRDHESGHDILTVYYRKDGRTIAYSIVSGDALEIPSSAQPSTRTGVEYRSFQHDGRTVVTWKRSGHTCVLSAPAVPRGELVSLADWRGKGAIPF